MNYKSIFKNRSTRLKVLRLLSFIPDKIMIKLQYRIKTGRKLDLNNPTRFTEKLQWYKLFYKNPLMIKCVDKFDVREYVKSKGLERILIPIVGVYDSPNEIDWDSLPNQFVMKDTLGGGGASVVIVTDKTQQDKNTLFDVAKKWVSTNPHVRDAGREWPYYKGKKHRIIIEQFIGSTNDTDMGLIDYKFFCFNGVPKWIYVIADRNVGHGAGVGIFDSGFIKQDVLRNDERPLERDIAKPENYDEMLKIAGMLSEDFPEARIDLYNISGCIKFGEITFYDGSGYMTFSPDSFDECMGKDFVLQKYI